MLSAFASQPPKARACWREGIPHTSALLMISLVAFVAAELTGHDAADATG